MISQLILVSLMISLATSKSCLAPASYILGSCFTFINTPMSFWEANSYCEYHSNNAWSYLALVESPEQSIWLAKSATMFTSENYWIGVYRPSVIDNFRTILNRYLTFQYFANINPSMNYAVGRKSDGKWETRPEEERFPFVCSYKPSEQTTPST
ncbi:Protein CBR-CLEC-172 [Caenorhabditis briggsae]|uniref:C-type lectin domain-containing protein n=2 Tax=Caenorhabditis briggsae TaxID=6238 RepID=A0AAE9D7X9_CAEBR|nr:Protein CBR-CLEC-172 [Caenorhabditis briggsae]ULT98193.1 hypothetical protein L3Y34_005775 [Caenorhabditis briggsae]CAP32339.1 Protein CBR-CLEC-172 [Caenorhabditis briggsae]